MQDEVFEDYLKRLNGGFYIPHTLMIVRDVLEGLYGHNRYEITVVFKPVFTLNKTVYIFNLFEPEYLRSKEFFDYLWTNNPNIESVDWLRQGLMNSIAGAKVVIHYPHIDITNSEKANHHIKDIYMKIEFNALGEQLGTFQMNKATYTLAEARSGYRHSHSPRLSSDSARYFQEWGSCCTGSGWLNNNRILSSSDELFITGYFKSLEGFLGWESIEGTPHTYMRTINQNGNSTVVAHYDKCEDRKSAWVAGFPNELFRYIVKRDDFWNHFKYLPSIKDNRPFVKLLFNEWDAVFYISDCINSYIATDEFLDLPISLRTKIVDYSKYKVIAKRDEIGDVEYLSINNTSNNTNYILGNIRGVSLFRFRGKEIKINIENDKDTYVELVNNCINPSILYALVSIIELIINSKNGTNKFDSSSL